MEEEIGPGAGTCAKRGRFWAVTDAAGRLVCLAVYKKGAEEVLRRLALLGDGAGEMTGTTETQRHRGERG